MMSSQQPASALEGETGQTKIIEVYEYPADCVASELSYHFSQPPYHAECKTPLPAIWNYKSLSFIMEYPVADVLRILQSPVQRLDESDPASEIKLSLLEARRGSQVIVSSQHEISHRMIKKFFRKFGEVESCQQSAAGEYAVILTFKNSVVAGNICSQGEYKIGPSLSVSVKLFTDTLGKGEPSSPTATSYTLDFDLDSASYADIPAHKQPESLTGKFAEALNLSEDFTYLEPQPLDSKSHSSAPSVSPRPSHTLEVSSSCSIENDSHHYETVEFMMEETTPPIKEAAPSIKMEADASAKVEAAAPAKAEEPLSPNISLHTAARPLYALPRVVLDSCVQVNNCIVRLVQGDISEHMADVLVHSGGQARQALARKWYLAAEPIQLIETIHASTFGNIRVTTAGNLPASYIFGFMFNTRPAALVESCKQLVKLCLHHCGVLKTRSIAFPALGTGMFGERPQVMARALVSSIIDYMKLNGQSPLEIIDVVIYQSAMLRDYSAVLKEAATSSRTSSLSNILAKRKGKVENVYQIPSKSHKIQLT